MSSTRQRVFSHLVASHPSFAGRTTPNADDSNAPNPSKKSSSSAPTATELLNTTSDLLSKFETLHNVERVPITDERIASIRVEIEKAMPYIYRFINKSGPPYPTTRFLNMKDHAEVCLRNFGVDLSALRPKASVTKTAPTSLKFSASTVNVPKQNQSPTIEKHTACPPSDSTDKSTRSRSELIIENVRMRQQATSSFFDPISKKSLNATVRQKALLCALHDTVETSFLRHNDGRTDLNDGVWMLAPTSMSPNEMQVAQRRTDGGDLAVVGGSNANGAGSGMVGTDGQAQLNAPFGSFAQHAYMQSVPSRHGVLRPSFPQHMNIDRNVGKGHVISDAHQTNV